LAAARAEEEVAATADATREAAAEAEVLRGSANSSVSADGNADADLEQWQGKHSECGRRSGQPSTLLEEVRTVAAAETT
jgi:hypothetical protein